MLWNDTATGIIAIGGGIVGFVSATTNYGTVRRAQYDRVLAETAKLTTGPIAISRHRLGLKLEEKCRENGPPTLADEEIGELYDVLWTFERLNALFISLKPILPRLGRFTRPERLLLISVRGSAATWVGFLDRGFEPRLNMDRSGLGVRHLDALAQRLNSSPGWRNVASSKHLRREATAAPLSPDPPR